VMLTGAGGFVLGRGLFIELQAVIHGQPSA
jgi:hypothetical protein